MIYVRSSSPLVSLKYKEIFERSSKFAATLTPRLESKGLKTKSQVKHSTKRSTFSTLGTAHDKTVSSFRSSVKKKTLAKYTTKLDTSQKYIYNQLGNNEYMRQQIIDSYRSGNKSVTSNLKQKSNSKVSKKITPQKPIALLPKKQSNNKKHVVTKSLHLIQNQISRISAVDSPFINESTLNNINLSGNSLILTKRFTSSSFTSPPRAKQINPSRDLQSKSISSVKKSQIQLNSYRESTKKTEHQKSQNSARELIKNVNNYKDLNKQENNKSKKMSKNSKYLTGKMNNSQPQQKTRQPSASYQTQPAQSIGLQNQSINIGQGQKQGFSLQLGGGSSPKNYQNSTKQNGTQFRITQKPKQIMDSEVEEDIPETDRDQRLNSQRHDLGDQYQMKTNLIATQNEITYGAPQFNGDLGDDMPQSEVSDDESVQSSQNQQIFKKPSQMLLANDGFKDLELQPVVEEKKEMFDYKNLRNQRKQNKINTSDQLCNELVNMININDQGSRDAKVNQVQLQNTIQREDLAHESAIFNLSVEPEVPVLRNQNFIQSPPMQYQEASTIQKILESSVELEQPKQTIQDYLQNLKPYQRENLRNNFAVYIQKWVRGHLTRIWFKKQQQLNFKQMRKFRRMLTVAYNRLRNKQVKQIIQVMKESGALHADQNYQLWQKYKEHCALMLQSHWRGYKERFLQIDEINEKIWECKRSRLLTAVVKGFKTRLLLHPKGYHKTMNLIRIDMNKIANQNNGKAMVIDVNDKLTLKNLMRKRRQKVLEYMKQFERSMKSKSILVSLLKARRNGSTFNANESKYDLGNSSLIQPYKKPNKDERKVQEQRNAKKMQDNNEDETYDEPELSSMWPSKKGEEQKDQGSSLLTKWPSKKKEEDSLLGSMWPSQIKEQEQSLSSMWPSQKNAEKKPNKKQVDLEKYSDDQSGDEGEIDWLNLPVKKPAKEKKENLKLDKKFSFEPKIKTKDFDKQSVGGFQSQNPFDEMPVGGFKNENDFDEIPVGVSQNSKQNIRKNDRNQCEVAQFGVRTSGGQKGAIIPMLEQEQEIPIRSQIYTLQENQNQTPNYDFEKMIEEAMKKNGEIPAVQAPPAVGEGQQNQQKRLQTKAKKVDPKKAALLAKRKAYDPRAAAKKKKNEDSKSDNSAISDKLDISQNIDDLKKQSKAKQQLNKSQMDKSDNEVIEESLEHQNQPDRPPRPFLKRKTKALVVNKKEKKEEKPLGISRIDCWQRDKDPNVSYGNKGKVQRKSLLKKRTTGIKEDNERSPYRNGPASAVQAQEVRNAYRPSPIRSRFQNIDDLEENEELIPDENESNEISQQQINNGRPSDGLSPNNINFYTDMQNQNEEEQFNFEGQKLQIDDLEQQFDFLHGANYCQRGDEYSLKNPLPANSKINSHDFKFSMIPFSESNNSQDVNLYSKNSHIPFLYKESMGEFGIKPQSPSLFFKCYSDDIYEAILEDLRSHYIAISNQDLDDSQENDIESDGHEEEDYGFTQGEVYQNTYTPDQPAVSGATQISGGRMNYQNKNNRF